MALLDTYGAFNKVINTSKIVTYTTTKLTGQSYETYGWNKDKIYQYTRNCTMSFEYVGMDLTTATACVNELVPIFTRSTRTAVYSKVSGAFVITSGDTRLMSEISIQKMEGPMYKVVVSVNETDTLSHVNPITTSLATFFATENARNYLEDED